MSELRSEILQDRLNRGLKRCWVQDGELRVCEYHEGRSQSVAFKIEEDVVAAGGRGDELRHTALVKPTAEMRSLAELLRSGPGPAGGWYLVKEQREWLEERLTDLLSGFGASETVRILEAGVASFVHHYTYLSILVDVLDRLPAPPRIHLVVADKCAYPIFQIDAVEELLAEGLQAPGIFGLFRPRTLSARGATLWIDGGFARMMNSHRRRFHQISCSRWIVDLREAAEVVRLGRFQVVTEHFLTSVMARNLDDIEAVRHSYAGVLEEGGHLLCATGLTPRALEHDQYVALHERHGLTPLEEHTRPTWDPYGLERQALLDFLSPDPEPVPVAIDNLLIDYVKR